MEEADAAARYWCHMCSEMVSPIMEVEMIKCPLCQHGFVEEMDNSSTSRSRTTSRDDHLDFGGGGGSSHSDQDQDQDRALSLWAPILLGMMSNPRRHRPRRFRRLEFEDDDEDDHHNDDNNRHREGEGDHTELDRELESIIRRRRRSSATILHLLQGIQSGMLSESENSTQSDHTDNMGDNRDRERVILINPFNQTIIVHGSYDSNQSQSQNQNPIGSLGDYFIGPGLDLLLQHLAENDPNGYGTPPAQKEAVEALPTVKIEQTLQCSVCLDDFEIGSEAKEMPCKHKFHSGCIMPWLELHSSCPVCRYQLPGDESKLNSDVPRSSSNNNNSGGEDNNGIGSSGEEGDGDGDGDGDGNGINGSGRQFSVPIPWPFSTLFSSSTNGNSSSNAPGNGNASHTDEN
uniref:RING-type E3 ubiquitin transferase n=1 Tax=Davidia involucrata TaxID=16924 RepID=A0A5B7C4U9_DAVIN